MNFKLLNEIQDDLTIATALITHFLSEEEEDEMDEQIEKIVMDVVILNNYKLIEMLMPYALKNEAYEACTILTNTKAKLDKCDE